MLPGAKLYIWDQERLAILTINRVSVLEAFPFPPRIHLLTVSSRSSFFFFFQIFVHCWYYVMWWDDRTMRKWVQWITVVDCHEIRNEVVQQFDKFVLSWCMFLQNYCAFSWLFFSVFDLSRFSTLNLINIFHQQNLCQNFLIATQASYFFTPTVTIPIKSNSLLSKFV